MHVWLIPPGPLLVVCAAWRRAAHWFWLMRESKEDTHWGVRIKVYQTLLSWALHDPITLKDLQLIKQRLRELCACSLFSIIVEMVCDLCSLWGACLCPGAFLKTKKKHSQFRRGFMNSFTVWFNSKKKTNWFEDRLVWFSASSDTWKRMKKQTSIFRGRSQQLIGVSVQLHWAMIRHLRKN